MCFQLSVKLTPVNLARNSISQEVAQSADDCLSLETMDLTDKVEYWPLTEIAVRISNLFTIKLFQ